MGSRHVTVVFAVAASALAACSFLVSTDGFQGGPDDASATPDAVVEAAASDVAVAPVATADTGTGTEDADADDASVIVDTGVDSGPPAGPVSTGQSATAKITCKGGNGICNAPATACCQIFGVATDYCVAEATAVADCHNSDPIGVIRCDEESDCPTGNFCCAVFGPSDDPIKETKCATSCAPGEGEMCRAGGAACAPGKSCMHIASVDAFNPGYGYRSCQ